MSLLFSLPKEILIEIILLTEDVESITALYCTCKQIRTLRTDVVARQEVKKKIIKTLRFHKSRKYAIINSTMGDHAFITIIRKQRENLKLDYKCRINERNIDKIICMSKQAGHIFSFVLIEYNRLNDMWITKGPVLDIILNWAYTEIKDIMYHEDGIQYTIGELIIHGFKKLEYFWYLYDKYYKGTILEKFPGKYLALALNTFTTLDFDSK